MSPLSHNARIGRLKLILNMVSIIIPVYNSSQYLERCVDSLLRQSEIDIEIILVNDGSIDGSKAICDRYSMSDKRIIVIHQENAGASVARNNGLAVAKGEYITFVDSDDYVDADYIRSMADVMKNTDCDLVITGRTQIKLDGSSNVTIPPALAMQDDEIREIFHNENFDYVRGGPCCKIYKKSIINNNNLSFPKDIHYLEDAIFVLEYIYHSSRVTSLAETHYFYELHPGSLVFSIQSLESELCGYNCFKAVFERYREKFTLSFADSYWFISNLNFMLYRQLKAISKESSMKDRISKYKMINWSDYRDFSARRGIKSAFINSLTYSNFGRALLSMLKII